MPTPGAAPGPPSPQPLPTYYPGALAIEQAQPIMLEKGQAVTDIDIVLAELSEGADTEVPLRRVSFAEAMSRR
jgi:hypothetical protein